MPLVQLKKYIVDNKHLPNIPTENEVIDNGVKLGEMNALLLKKVEELTLYTLKQQELLEKQMKILNHQQQEIDKLKSSQ